MNKKLNTPCHEAEVIFDRCWKVVIKYMGNVKYCYVFNNEDEAFDKFNNLK